MPLSCGGSIEAAMVGRDSVHGIAALHGQVSVSTPIVQIPGAGSTLDVGLFRKIADESSHFRTTLMQHGLVLFVQAQQAAACNASHTVEARLARGLLRARDLAGSNTLLLTQEFLAQMLGAQRSSVSLVAHTLQQAGLIRYRRERIEITNLDGLRETSCECYDMVKGHYDRLLNGS